MNSNKKYSSSFNTISPTISPTPFGIPPSSNYHISFPYILPSQRSKVRKRINRNDFRRVNRKADEESFVRRFGKRYGAGTAPDNEGYPQCDNVSNSVTTCYPDSETSIDQSQYSKLIWNPNLPQLLVLFSFICQLAYLRLRLFAQYKYRQCRHLFILS